MNHGDTTSRVGTGILARGIDGPSPTRMATDRQVAHAQELGIRLLATATQAEAAEAINRRYAERRRMGL